MDTKPITEQITGLTTSEQGEVIALVLNEWKKWYHHQRRDAWRTFFNVYNQKYSIPLRQNESWIQGIRVFMPTVRMLVNSLEPTMTNFLMPNDEYLEIEQDPILEDFYTKVALTNNEFTDFKTSTQRNVIQACITGDTYTLTQQKGPYFESRCISNSDIVVTPLQEDISNSTKILRFFKTPYDLQQDVIQGQAKYFALDDLEDEGFKKQFERRLSAGNKNPHDRGEDAQLGEGLTIYEAHIYHHKLESGKRVINTIVTIVDEPKRIIRFEPNSNIKRIKHTTWSVTPPNVYYGTGIVEPAVPLVNYSNSLMTAELVGLMLDAMSGYTYNITDEQTRIAVKKGKFQINPFALIGVGPNAQLQPLVRPTTRRSGFEFFNAIKQELIEVSNANTGVSGVNSVGGFPESKEFQQLQYGANSSRLESTAKWWDKNYLVTDTYEKIKEIQQTLFDNVPDGFGGSFTMPNYRLIQWHMKKIGWDDQKISEKLDDPSGRFLQVLAQPIEFSQVKAIGTQSVINKQRDLEAFSKSVAEIRPEESPVIKWPEVSRERFKRHGVKDPNKFVLTDEEIAEAQAIQQEQMAQEQAQAMQIQPEVSQEEELDMIINALESSVNPDTGEPLTDEDSQILLETYKSITGEDYQRQEEAQSVPAEAAA